MKRRRITIEMTEAEFNGLCHAAVELELVWEERDRPHDSTPEMRRAYAAFGRLENKLGVAWHSAPNSVVTKRG